MLSNRKLTFLFFHRQVRVFVYSFYLLFHTAVVLVQLLVVVYEFLGILITIILSSISDSLVTSISFNSFSGDSSIPFDCRFFFCLTILGDSFCLFLHILMLGFAGCLCRVNFCGRNSVGFSGVVSLISSSGCSRFALSFVCVESLVVLGFLPFGGSS